MEVSVRIDRATPDQTGYDVIDDLRDFLQGLNESLVEDPAHIKAMEVGGIGDHPSWNVSSSGIEREAGKLTLDILNGNDGQLNRTVVIGLYHLFHTGLKFQAMKINMKLCDFNNCKISFIKNTGNKVYDVDALLIQGNNVPDQLPVRRDPNQVFTFFSVESPQNLRFTSLQHEKFRHFFNWTMTYRTDSDIFYPYGQILPHDLPVNSISSYRKLNGLNPVTYLDISDEDFNNPGGIPGKDYEGIYAWKSRTASWIVSHCETESRREVFVDRLKSVIDVDVFGECNNVTCNRRDPQCEKKIVTEHKFYLAFENSLCRDYITEKALKWFRRDIVLVIRGASNTHEHLPRGTYVDADHFDSPEALGKHLKELAADKEEYVRMLKRKDAFGTSKHQANAQAAYCNLCGMLNHVDQFRKSVADINTWWTHGMCTLPRV